MPAPLLVCPRCHEMGLCHSTRVGRDLSHRRYYLENQPPYLDGTKAPFGFWRVRKCDHCGKRWRTAEFPTAYISEVLQRLSDTERHLQTAAFQNRQLAREIESLQSQIADLESQNQRALVMAHALVEKGLATIVLENTAGERLGTAKVLPESSSLQVTEDPTNAKGTETEQHPSNWRTQIGVEEH